jgi:hypothetical protein
VDITALFLAHPVHCKPRDKHILAWSCASPLVQGSWAIGAPTKIVVRPGFAWIELKAAVSFSSNLTGMRQIWARKNGSNDRAKGYPPGYLSATSPGGYGPAHSVSFAAHSAVMPVVPGDYFELFAYHDATSALWIGGPVEVQDPSELPAFGCVYFQAHFYQ